MENEYLISIENRIHGFLTRLKELHFSSPIPVHNLIDSYSEDLRKFEDSIMEDAQSIFGLIKVGQISPVIPEAQTFIELLGNIRGMLSEMKDKLTEKMYSGIISCVDEFWHKTNTALYLMSL